MMKKIILLMLSVYQIALAFYMSQVSEQYAYVKRMMGNWLLVLVFGVFMAVAILLLKKDHMKDAFKLLIVAYPLSLLGITFLFFHNVPAYSYKEAINEVKQKTGEEVIETNNLKAQYGYYYLHTPKHRYQFNSQNGNFTKERD